MMDLGDHDAAEAAALSSSTQTDPRPHVLLVEDDARLVTPLTEAIREVGLEPMVVSAIGDDFIPFTRQSAPAAVIVDLLLPTADALRLGRWIGGLCHGPVLVVVPGSPIPTIPDASTDRLRVVRRPVAPAALAGLLVQAIQMRRVHGRPGAHGDPGKRTA
ncbi:MAG: hypothetical protein WBA46_16660 [Thermomicrobiales bacterium]